jgi:hypothetical protein
MPKLTKRCPGELKMQRLISGRDQEKENGVDDDNGGQEKRAAQLTTKGRSPKMLLDGFRQLGCHCCIVVQALVSSECPSYFNHFLMSRSIVVTGTIGWSLLEHAKI